MDATPWVRKYGTEASLGAAGPRKLLNFCKLQAVEIMILLNKS